MIRVSSLIISLLVGGGFARAEDPKTGFIDREYKNADDSLSKYVLFVPHDYSAEKKYPVILFLHGAGERGTDGKKQAQVGLGPAIKKREKEFGFIAIFPQASSPGQVIGRWREGSPDAARALAILDQISKEYSTDPKRVYLTGLSMGGFGTWNLAAHHPERWAAIVPICGGGNPKDAAKIKDLPCWCFHGGDDRVVPASASKRMIDALKEAGAEPKYTEYEGVGHNSWDRAYNTPELYDWLLTHQKE